MESFTPMCLSAQHADGGFGVTHDDRFGVFQRQRLRPQAGISKGAIDDVEQTRLEELYGNTFTEMMACSRNNMFMFARSTTVLLGSWRYTELTVNWLNEWKFFELVSRPAETAMKVK